MKILADREQLLAGLSAVSPAVPARSPKPVLQKVKLTCAADSGSRLMGTDLELGVTRALLGIKVESPGSVLIDPGRLSQILKSCKDDELSIESDMVSVSIRGRRANFKLATEDPELFPDPPTEPGAGDLLWSIAPDAFSLAIRRTAFATDPDSTRYALAGVLFDTSGSGGSQIAMVATDGRRMARQYVQAEAIDGADAPGNPPVIPVRALNLVARVADDDPISLSVSTSSALFRTGRTTISTRLVEGRFPNCQAVIPGTSRHRVRFTDAGSLLEVVEQSRIATSKESRGIDWEFSAGDMLGPTLKISSQTADIGEASAELGVECDTIGADTLGITFDGVYASELLKALDPGQPITLEMTDHKSAAVVVTEDGYTHVLMPLNRDR